MRNRRDRFAWLLTLAATGAVLGIQLHHTVRNKNRWPWCSYNMFSYRKGSTAKQLRIRLVTTSGECLDTTDPWGLLPLEFFRVIGVLERVFFTESDLAAREEFCRTALDRLNRRPWRGWDEVKAAPKAPAGQRFAALELYLVDVDFDRCDPTDRTHVTGAQLVHRHDPAGVAALCPPVRWRFATTTQTQPTTQDEEVRP